MASSRELFSLSPFRPWSILGHGASLASCRMALGRHHACSSVLALEDLLRRLIVLRLVIWPLRRRRWLSLWLRRVLATWSMALTMTWWIASAASILWLCLWLSGTRICLIVESGILRHHSRMVAMIRLCHCSSSWHIGLTLRLILAVGLLRSMVVRLRKAFAGWCSCWIESSLSCSWGWPCSIQRHLQLLITLWRAILLLPHLPVQMSVLLEPVSIHPLPFHLHDVDDRVEPAFSSEV